MGRIDAEGPVLRVGQTELQFRHPVRQWLRAGEAIVVLLAVPVGEIDNRNVVGVSTDGERLWEIEPIGDDPTADQAYVNLYRRDGGVWLGNPIGAALRIDPATGDVLERVTRR